MIEPSGAVDEADDTPDSLVSPEVERQAAEREEGLGE